jgi:hypothetical protein
MKMVIKAKGKIKFEPENKTKKHENQDWKKIAMIMVNGDIDDYYGWFLLKRFNPAGFGLIDGEVINNMVVNAPKKDMPISLNFIKNLRGPHITFISDRINSKIFEQAKEQFDNKEITFYYEIEPRTNGKHWWLRIHCPDAEIIRESMGLSKEPYFGFHLTIGYVNEKNISHSEYIYRSIKKFNILSNEPRKPLSAHRIISF